MKNAPKFLETFLPQINEAVTNTAKKRDEVALYVGDLGNAVYWTYLYKVTGDEQYFAKADEIVSEHMDKLNEYVYNYKFAYGIPGFAWFIQFLVNNDILEPQEYLEELDQHIEKSLRWNYEDKHYDLFTGYIGKLLYFVERYEATKNEYHKSVLANAVQEIYKSATIQKDGEHITWLDTYTSYYVNFRGGEPFYGFGMSHGVPSLIYFLAVCSDFGINKEFADDILRKSVRYVLDNQIDAPDYFPDRLYNDGYYTKVHTLAWCYGVLSVCISLYAAAKALKDDDLLQKVYDIVKDSAAYYNLENANLGFSAPGCPNLFFCHGTAGVGHIFHKFGKVYNDDFLKEKGDYWLTQTAKYLPKFPWTDKEIYEGTGIVEGPSGIGMIFLDRISQSEDYNWNKMFMSDIDRF